MYVATLRITEREFYNTDIYLQLESITDTVPNNKISKSGEKKILLKIGTDINSIWIVYVLNMIVIWLKDRKHKGIYKVSLSTLRPIFLFVDYQLNFTLVREKTCTYIYIP